MLAKHRRYANRVIFKHSRHAYTCRSLNRLAAAIGLAAATLFTENRLSSLSLHQDVHAAPPAVQSQSLRFGFPRVYLAQVLQRKITEQLCIGKDACFIGRCDEAGRFHTLEQDDDFDGPHFTLRLTYAIAGHQVFDHDIDIVVGILFGRYLLDVRGHRFDIPVLPSLDSALLTTAVRRIIRDLGTTARKR